MKTQHHHSTSLFWLFFSFIILNALARAKPADEVRIKMEFHHDDTFFTSWLTQFPAETPDKIQAVTEGMMHQLIKSSIAMQITANQACSKIATQSCSASMQIDLSQAHTSPSCTGNLVTVPKHNITIANLPSKMLPADAVIYLPDESPKSLREFSSIFLRRFFELSLLAKSLRDNSVTTANELEKQFIQLFAWCIHGSRLNACEAAIERLWPSTNPNLRGYFVTVDDSETKLSILRNGLFAQAKSLKEAEMPLSQRISTYFSRMIYG